MNRLNKAYELLIACCQLVMVTLSYPLPYAVGFVLNTCRQAFKQGWKDVED